MSATQRHFIFVLPAFNEGARLEQLLDRIRDAMQGRPYKIVAVDDGSKDETPRILERRKGDLPLEVVTHEVNRGLAQTLYDGLAWVAKNAGEEDVAITMDADDTHDPVYAPAMVDQLDQGYDVVIASRFQPGSQVVGVPAHRLLYSAGVRLLLQLLLPMENVRDYACGYRAVRTSIIRRALNEFGEDLIELRDWGFICTAEVLWKLHLAGARCSEIPFTLRYDMKESVSRMRTMRTVTGYALLIRNGWRAKAAHPAPPQARHAELATSLPTRNTDDGTREKAQET
jgi:dolichol-phosphate mannosyltransferase